MRLPGRPAGNGRGLGRATSARPAARRARRVGRPAPVGGEDGSIGRLLRWGRLPRFTPARAAALLGILASSGAIYGLASTPAFAITRAEIPELRWTSRAALEAAAQVPPGENLFRLAVGPLESRIEALPGVANATVVVSLPDTLVVRIEERVAILAWSVADQRFLIDREGVIFASAAPGEVTAAGLPVIGDSRAASAMLVVGDVLDPVDLDAATRLGSLLPADVGSIAAALLVTVADANGFVVGTSPPSWVAVFGLYTPSRRTPELIPGQIRLLRSLLDGREATIAQVILADAENGTFIERPAPPGSAP